MSAIACPSLPRTHARRLRAYYRSAGWPCLDAIEVDLLNAGLIERCCAQAGPDRIRLTEAGLQALGRTLQTNRRAFDAHEDLVARMARELAAAGRLVYRDLSLRGRVESGWQACRADLYSIRHTSVAAYARPVIHEIKVRRADLQSDLRKPLKRAAYQALSSEFYYVMPAGLAQPDEVPADCGLIWAESGSFRLLRPSATRAVQLSTAEWMALARRGAEFLDADPDQLPLRAPPDMAPDTDD